MTDKNKIEKEYWKIKHLKDYLLILAKEDKLRCEVIRDEESDTVIRIKLMQEAQEFGFQLGKSEINKIQGEK